LSIPWQEENLRKCTSNSKKWMVSTPAHFQGRFRAFLHHEPGPLVRGFFRGHTFLHPSRPAGPVVLRLGSLDFRRSLLWIPETSHRTSGQDQSDPETNPRAKHLHPGLILQEIFALLGLYVKKKMPCLR